jgi:uncharacterized membrane protein
VIHVSDETIIKKIYSAFFQQEFSADLTLIVVWLAVSIIVNYLSILDQTPIPMIFALPVILIIPGYCLLAALFPRSDDIGLSERIALSIGLSIAILALIALGLYFTSIGIQLGLTLLAVSLITWVMILVAHYRRALLPIEERFRMPFYEIANAIREALFPPDNTRIDRLLSVILVVIILIAITTTIYVIASPKESEHFSEFFILGENKMAADYPSQIITGQSYPMFIGVGNHEYRNMTYTIETWATLTEFDNVTNSTTVIKMNNLDKRSLTIAHNETTIIPYTLSLNKTGYNRMEFLLFNETIPGPNITDSDRINSSYRDLYLIVTVKEPEYQELSTFDMLNGNYNETKPL